MYLCTYFSEACIELFLEGICADAWVSSLQPFYSTEKITGLVKDVEQHLSTLLVEEQGVHFPPADSSHPVTV